MAFLATEFPVVLRHPATIAFRSLLDSERTMTSRRTIVFYEFNIDIVGPRYRNKYHLRRIRKLLSRALPDIEKAALAATKARLPKGFRAELT
jgi:hypothetical protein